MSPIYSEECENSSRCSSHLRVVIYLARGSWANSFAFLCPSSFFFSETQLTQDVLCRVEVTSRIDVHEVLSPEPDVKKVFNTWWLLLLFRTSC